MNSKQKKNVVVVLVLATLLIGGLAFVNLRVELPPEYQGTFSVTGEIDSCEFGKLGKFSSKFFVGIILKGSQDVYRANPKHTERIVYENICNSSGLIKMKYHAVKRLVGPPRFWVDTIEVSQYNR